jgi:hypothetical protein
MIGVHPARIGKSEAGRRITLAGRAFALAHPELPEFRKPAAISPPDPPAAVGPPAPPRRADRTFSGRCHEIIEEVARLHRVRAEAIVSPKRAHHLLPARFEAIYRCVAETELTLAAIGRIFRRDHTSIGAAVMRHHHLTGAPLPRGMNWTAGDLDKRKARRQRRKQRLEAIWQAGLAALREGEVAAPALQPAGAGDDATMVAAEAFR